ncbi:MAG TPA: type II secretion system protein [Thiomicrorhabdus sp.]|nr:type II secretion system protein [Thiomicrorhabdus sp.]
MRKESNKMGLKQGYTLIEMGVVLVIIAILMGGLFKGKEFIENAKLKTVMNDFEHITQAYYTYVQRTGVAPGLARDASGNIISNSISSTDFFQDLLAEGLMVSDSSVATLKNAFDGVWSISPEFELCSNTLPGYVARGIDTQLDDGVPNTGLVVTRDSSNTTLVSDYTVASATDDVFTVCKRL